MMVRRDGTQCRNIDESVDLLLNELIPNDLQEQELMEEERSTCDLLPIDDYTLKVLAWTISPNRAPGRDGITGRIIRVPMAALLAKAPGPDELMYA